MFYFNDVLMETKSKGLHLGHIIGPNVEPDVLRDASNILIPNINMVLHNFSHCTYDVKFKLFMSYCTSFYCSPLWDLTDTNISHFYVSWHKSIRRIFDLPYRTHCNLLPVIADCLPNDIQIMC